MSSINPFFTRLTETIAVELRFFVYYVENSFKMVHNLTRWYFCTGVLAQTKELGLFLSNEVGLTSYKTNLCFINRNLTINMERRCSSLCNCLCVLLCCGDNKNVIVFRHIHFMGGKSSTQRERFYYAVCDVIMSACATNLSLNFLISPNYTKFAVECDWNEEYRKCVRNVFFWKNASILLKGIFSKTRGRKTCRWWPAVLYR